MARKKSDVRSSKSEVRSPKSAGKGPKSKGRKQKSVLQIASEALPFAKTGGLADVLGALPPALARLGWDVTVVLPKYRGVDGGSIVEHFPVTVGGFTREATFFETAMTGGARAVLVQCDDLYDRDGIYGIGTVDYADSPRRFAYLVRAAFEYAARRGSRPSVVHAHDWQAGLAPVYLKTLYADHPILGGTPSVQTIHNLAYQGLYEPDWLPRIDLGWDQLTIDRMEFWNRISLLKGGINAADLVTTVSERYATEIQTPEFGFGFDGIMRARRASLVGILNGIDVDEWDPARDRFLPQPFSIDALDGKRAAKRELLARYGLPVDEAAVVRPLVGMVSRMVDQKGLDLISALDVQLPRLDASFVVLGTGEPRYQDFWTNLAAAHPDRVAVRIGFDEGLAHLIEGGADLFLMPSRFEPSGLNQMYSMRYGTVPVVHAVGGLADTVTPDTGFVFDRYTPDALLACLTRAVATFADPRAWQALQQAGMARDFSWDRSAKEYVKIYDRLITQRT